MSSPEHLEIERAIERALLEQWDPLNVHDAPGVHEEYHRYVHELFSLLARGGSDVQVARYLHRIEAEELGHPELAARDLTAVLHTLRAIERTI